MTEQHGNPPEVPDMPAMPTIPDETTSLNWLNAKGVVVDPNLQLAYLQSTQAFQQANFTSWNAAQLAARQQWQAQMDSEERAAYRQAERNASADSLGQQRQAYNQSLAATFKRRDGNDASIDYVSIQKNIFEQALYAGTVTGTNEQVLGASTALVAALTRMVSQLDNNAIIAFAAGLSSAKESLDNVTE